MGKSCSKSQGVSDFHVEGIVNPRLGPEGECHTTAREIIELSHCPDASGVTDTPCKRSRTASTSLMLTNSLNQGQELPETERTAGSGVTATDDQDSEGDIMELKRAVLKECDLVVDLPPEGCDDVYKKKLEIFGSNCGPSLPTTPQFTEEKGKELDTRSASSCATLNREEWSYNLYDFEGRGKVTDQDLSQLMRSICTVVGQSVDKRSCSPDHENKMLKVRLSIGQHKKYKEEVKREDRESKSSGRTDAKLPRNNNESPNGFSRMILPPPNTEEALKLSHYIEERLSMHTDKSRWKDKDLYSESPDTQSEILSDPQMVESRSHNSPDTRSEKCTRRIRSKDGPRSRESWSEQSESSRLRGRFRTSRSGSSYKKLQKQDNSPECSGSQTPSRILRASKSRTSSSRCSPTNSNSETLDKSLCMSPNQQETHIRSLECSANPKHSPVKSNSETSEKPLYVLPKRQETYGGSDEYDAATTNQTTEQCISRRESRHRKRTRNVSQQVRLRTSEKSNSRVTDTACRTTDTVDSTADTTFRTNDVAGRKQTSSSRFQNNNDHLLKDGCHKNESCERQREPVSRRCPCKQRTTKLAGRGESPVVSRKYRKPEGHEMTDRCHHETNNTLNSNHLCCCHCRPSGTCANGSNCNACGHRQKSLPVDCVHRHEHVHYHYYLPQHR